MKKCDNFLDNDRYPFANAMAIEPAPCKDVIKGIRGPRPHNPNI